MGGNDVKWCFCLKNIIRYNMQTTNLIKICYIQNVVANYKSSHLLMPKGSGFSSF